MAWVFRIKQILWKRVMTVHPSRKRYLFLLLVLGSINACQPINPVAIESIRPIKAMQVGSADQISGEKIPGLAKATQEVELSFRVSGSLQKMPINIGKQVRIGDTLAELDKRDFEVSLDNAKANLENAIAQLKNAKIEFERVVRIQRSNPGAVSQSNIDQKHTVYDSAKANKSSAIAQMNAAQDRLNYATLKAPFNGVIVQRYVENYQDITANSPIFRLVDISKIEMDVSIPENQIAHLPYVKNPRVTFEAFPDIEIPAQIKEVSNEASKITRTYNIRMIMDPPPGIDILPGMSGYATADIVLPGQEFQVIIPLSAVFSSADSLTTFVWKYSKKTQTVSRTAVQKGGISEQGLIINNGLKSGDWIATAGVHFLVEGQKVRLLDNAGVR